MQLAGCSKPAGVYDYIFGVRYRLGISFAEVYSHMLPTKSGSWRLLATLGGAAVRCSNLDNFFLFLSFVPLLETTEGHTVPETYEGGNV
jgi:hypothetical protein